MLRTSLVSCFRYVPKALFSCGIIAAMAVGVSTARAATIQYATDFNSATVGHAGNYSTSASYTDGAIIGQDGWAITGTSTVNAIGVANTATNGNVTLTTTGQDVQRQFATASPITGAGAKVFLSADIDVTAATATGDYFIHLDDGSTSIFPDRVFAKSSGSGFVMAVATGSGATPTYGTTVLSLNTVYHVVAEYDFVAGTVSGTLGNDTAALYVNPTDPIVGGDNLYVAGTTQGADPTQVTGVNLRQGTASTAPNVIVDNIAVASVAPAPEPVSIALIGLGSLGLLRRRRAA
jgi:hypothetical protein